MLHYLFIDFENTQKVKLEEGGGAFDKILIFVGRSQNKLDFELVQRLQSLGSRVEWVKIGGEGKNNLDFHLSYMLGRMDAESDKSIGFTVLSRDKGYDALLRYISDNGRETRRVDNLGKCDRAKQPAKQEPQRGRRRRAKPQPAAQRPASQAQTRGPDRGVEALVLAALERLPANQRPSTKVRFQNYLQNQHGAGKTAPPAADILEALLRTGKVCIDDNRVTYRL
ncbi:MAG: hypothetical protein HY748_04260 [Elusimicrobia bacterium]|nr:hypothetical protein [Elusimicrobiota bacterium]